MPIDERTYWRLIKESPGRVTLSIRMDAPVTEAIEQAARTAVLNSGRLGDLPPFDLLINAKSIPLNAK